MHRVITFSHQFPPSVYVLFDSQDIYRLDSLVSGGGSVTSLPAWKSAVPNNNEAYYIATSVPRSLVLSVQQIHGDSNKVAYSPDEGATWGITTLDANNQLGRAAFDRSNRSIGWIGGFYDTPTTAAAIVAAQVPIRINSGFYQTWPLNDDLKPLTDWYGEFSQPLAYASVDAGNSWTTSRISDYAGPLLPTQVSRNPISAIVDSSSATGVQPGGYESYTIDDFLDVCGLDHIIDMRIPPGDGSIEWGERGPGLGSDLQTVSMNDINLLEPVKGRWLMVCNSNAFGVVSNLSFHFPECIRQLVAPLHDGDQCYAVFSCRYMMGNGTPANVHLGQWISPLSIHPNHADADSYTSLIYKISRTQSGFDFYQFTHSNLFVERAETNPWNNDQILMRMSTNMGPGFETLLKFTWSTKTAEVITTPYPVYDFTIPYENTIYAISNEHFMLSTNLGANWTTVDVPQNPWYSSNALAVFENKIIVPGARWLDYLPFAFSVDAGLNWAITAHLGGADMFFWDIDAALGTI